MSRIHVTALLAFSTLVLPASIAHGQSIFGGGNAAANSTASQGNATGRQDVQQCQAAPGGSRMRRRNSAECEAAAAAGMTVRTEQELKVSLEAPQLDAPQCEASTLTEYSQRNTVARVTATVSTANCPAGSTGTFDVVARIKDESGEIKPLEFAQSWQHDDGGSTSLTNDYPIGENVDLVNVRIRNLKCTCAGATEAPPAETPAPN